MFRFLVARCKTTLQEVEPMAATTTSYSTLSLEEAAREAAERGFGLPLGGGAPAPENAGRGRVAVRRDLDINSFGVNAYYQASAGGIVIGEHDELGPGSSGHEELYVVVSGGATFTVDGDEVEAPHGTAVFVRDPASKRAARATEDGTIVFIVGGRPGEAFRPSAGEAMSGFFQHYRDEEYEAALAVVQGALEQYPGNALLLY